MSYASLRVVSSRVPLKVGAGLPAAEVEKKTGVMPSKSFSSIMRFMSTEPTMPR